MKPKAPAKSPDLNPIELVWAPLKRLIAKKPNSNDDEVFAAASLFWSELTPAKCSAYINHMVNRVIPAVIANNGGKSNM